MRSPWRRWTSSSSELAAPLPLFHDEAATFLDQVFGRCRRVLLGRLTYELFAGYWGVMPDPDDNPIAGPLNRRPKYMASTTITDPQWADTTVLSGDLATANSHPVSTTASKFTGAPAPTDCLDLSFSG